MATTFQTAMATPTPKVPGDSKTVNGLTTQADGNATEPATATTLAIGDNILAVSAAGSRVLGGLMVKPGRYPLHGIVDPAQLRVVTQLLVE